MCEVREKIRIAFLDVVWRDKDVRKDSVTSCKETVDPILRVVGDSGVHGDIEQLSLWINAPERRGERKVECSYMNMIVLSISFFMVLLPSFLGIIPP